MSIEKAKAYLRQYGLEDRIQEFEASTATVELAADAVGCTPGEIAKTMSFIKGDQVTLILTEGTARIDNRKFKDTFHCKARMIPWDDVEERTGHAPGGVCPFGAKDDVTVYLDVSLKKYEIVYPAAGNDHTAVRLRIDELERSLDYPEWVDVCKAVQ